MDRGTWWAVVHGVTKSRTQLSDFSLTFHFHALEKEMATHSSVSCLENPKDRGACWAAIYGVAQSRTQLKRLSSSSSRLVLKDYLLSFLCIIKKKVFIFRVKLFWITFQSKADDVCVFCKILSCKILYHQSIGNTPFLQRRVHCCLWIFLPRNADIGKFWCHIFLTLAAGVNGRFQTSSHRQQQ